MRTRTAVFFTLIAYAVLACVPARGQEGQKPKPWKGSVELSYLTTNGNVKATTIANKDLFQYESGPSLLELEGGGMRTKTQGLLQERYFGSEKYGFKWSDKDYVFEKFRWDKDRSAGVNDRFEASAGLGRKLLDRPKDKLVGELGGGRVWEDRLAPALYNAFSAGRAFARYEHAFTEFSGFGQEAEFLHNFDRPRDYRLRTETSLTATITKVFKMKAAYTWRRQGMPPPNFTRDDTQFSMGVLVSL